MNEKIGIVGAGQMGRGIAHVAALAGYDVFLADNSLELAQRGQGILASSLKKLVEKQKISSEQCEDLIGRIKPVNTFDLESIDALSCVIEAAPEDIQIKKEIFTRLDATLNPSVLLASNTSSISITQIAAFCKHASRVIGMHFMNPVPLMALVEVIRGVQTSDETYQKTKELAARFKKTVVTSQDYPGFIVNRVLMPMINEAAYALMEGVASADDIDTAMKLGTNQPMGPLMLADLIGLDTCLAILEVMHRDLGDPKYRPCPLLRNKVHSGSLGRKTGCGFHKHA